MFSTLSGKSCNGFSVKLKNILTLCLTSIALSGCSNIMVQPNDPELLGFEKFAKQVTTHLFEQNPSTYSEFQSSLKKELAPNVLAQMQKQGICASSSKQIQENIKTMDKHHKRCLIQVRSTGFPDKATAQGLVPIEVRGTSVKTINDLSKASEFDVSYLIGFKPGTKEPIIATVEIKKFD